MMRGLLIGVFAAFLVAPAFAQDTGLGDDIQTGLDQIDESQIGFGASGGLSFEDLQNFPDNGIGSDLEGITTQTRDSVSAGTGGNLRALDKLTGEVVDLTVAAGQTADFGRMTVYLGDCRYPEGNPSGDAYAYVTVSVEGMERAAFSGWMVASSPALNAMDHARYDLWALTCSTS